MKKILFGFLLLFVLIGCNDPNVEPISLEIEGIRTEIVVGDSFKLSATITPSEAIQTIHWSSSDEEIARIDDNGNFEAIAAGTISITAVSTVNEEIKETISLTIIEDNKPKAIEILGMKDDLYIGETIQLQSKISPANAPQTILWESSDEEIAKVDSTGRVEALAKGVVNIKVTSTVNEELTTTIQIKVNELSAPTDLEIQTSKEKISVGDEIQLRVVVAPGTSDAVLWSSSDEEIAKVSPTGKVSALKAGVVSITAVSTLNQEVSKTIELTIADGTIAIFNESLVLRMNEGRFIPINFTGIEIERIQIDFSNQEILDFDPENLFIRAKKYGYSTITISVLNHDFKGEIDVLVEEADVLPLEMQPSGIIVDSLNPFTFYTKNLQELGAGLGNFDFTFNDDDLAWMDDNYLIYPKKPGVLEVTATLKSNPEISSSFSVTIADENYDRYFLTPENNVFKVKPGEYLDLYVDGKRENLEFLYNFSSYRVDIASITADGRVVGIKEGIGYFGITNKTTGKSGFIYILIEGETNQVNYIERLISIALAEEGYREEANGFTKYGHWFKQNYELLDWCAMFVAWSANQAGIPPTVIISLAKVSFMVEDFKTLNRYYERDEYIPVRGDIIFFNNMGHVGIVTGTSDGYVHTIEGNTSNMVAQRSYLLTNTYIDGYANPNYASLNF